MTAGPGDPNPGVALPGELEAALRRLVRAELRAEVVRTELLAGGLGRRRFLRLHTDGTPATLVARIDAEEDPARRPTGLPPEPDLEPLRSFLEGRGIPVPRSYGRDAAHGIHLIEDAGPTSLRDAVAARPDERLALYEEACDLVPRFQESRDPGDGLPAFSRRLDAAFFAYKADFFARWSLPLALRREARDAERAVVHEAFAAIAAELRGAPHRLAHRDYQSANLHVRKGAPRGKRLVVLDVQGALLAPPEYDLVCLLRDSYVELPEDEVAHHVARTRLRLPDAPAETELARRFDLLTLTRKGKDHALFVYTAETRGDRSYLAYLPATVRYLRAAAARAAARDPALARLAELVSQLPESRCAP